MSTSGSVSEWIEDLKLGDSSAATHLWNRYHQNLLRFARQRLHQDIRRVSDEEDLVAVAFESFFARALDGQFPELSGREQLWALLLTIADRKAVNAARRYLADKRGGGKVHGESNFRSSDDSSDDLLVNRAQTQPPPELAAYLGELIESLDDQTRQLVRLRVDGYRNDEISQRLDCSLATVERRLRLLRDRWLKELLG